MIQYRPLRMLVNLTKYYNDTEMYERESMLGVYIYLTHAVEEAITLSSMLFRDFGFDTTKAFDSAYAECCSALWSVFEDEMDIERDKIDDVINCMTALVCDIYPVITAYALDSMKITRDMEHIQEEIIDSYFMIEEDEAGDDMYEDIYILAHRIGYRNLIGKHNRYTRLRYDDYKITKKATEIARDLFDLNLITTPDIYNTWQYGFDTETGNLLVLFDIKPTPPDKDIDEYFLIEDSGDEIVIHTKHTTLHTSPDAVTRIIKIVKEDYDRQVLKEGAFSDGDGDYTIEYIMNKVNQ